MSRKKRRFTQRGSAWQPTDDQLICRDIQHSWSPHTARSIPGYGYERLLRCGRCGSVKEQVLDDRGYILRTAMKYPEGYLRPGEGRMTRDERAELRVRNL